MVFSFSSFCALGLGTREVSLTLLVPLLTELRNMSAIMKLLSFYVPVIVENNMYNQLLDCGELNNAHINIELMLNAVYDPVV